MIPPSFFDFTFFFYFPFVFTFLDLAGYCLFIGFAGFFTSGFTSSIIGSSTVGVSVLGVSVDLLSSVGFLVEGSSVVVIFLYISSALEFLIKF